MLDGCPLCTLTVPCDLAGCDDPARYGMSLSCGCVSLFCVRDAYGFAGEHGWDGDEFMCPTCLTVVELVGSDDIRVGGR